MIKISPSGWIAIVTCSCVISWTKGANLSSQATCSLTSSQQLKFKQLVKSKATLNKFEKEFGRGCKLGKSEKRKIVFWDGKDQSFSVQFHTKTKKAIKVKYVKKTNQRSKKKID